MLIFARRMLDGVFDENAAVAVDVARYGGVLSSVHSVEWSDTTTGGTVVVEAAPRANYTGTWEVLGTLPWPGASQTNSVKIDGSYAALRHRISSLVLGGTVKSRLDSVD